MCYLFHLADLYLLVAFFFLGTFAPAFLASDIPIAIACFLLVTFLPLPLFKVPCFLLNPLVENAVKHGLQTSPKPLSINICAKIFGGKLILEVSNSGKLKNDLNENGTNIGLRNVRERLEKIYGDNGKFELKQDDNFVKARIEITDEVQNNNR